MSPSQVPDLDHLSAEARYSLYMLAQEIQKDAQEWSRYHRKEAEAAALFLSIYRLGVALENYTKLNGHMTIIATFTPLMPLFEEDAQASKYEEERNG